MKTRLHYLFISLALLAFGTSKAQLSGNDESITVNKLFETSDYSHYQFTDNTFTPVIRYKGAVYFVYADLNRRPILGKTQNGVTTTHFLDDDPNYFAHSDRHHMFSIAIDKNGFIHVLGDMHNFPHSTANHAHMPAEFQSAYIMYWKSQTPEDISSMDFVGNDANRVPPGFAFSYYSFQLDMNQELFMLARIRTRKTQLKAGINALGLYKYDADAQTWEALGELPPVPSGDHPPLFKCIVWEDNGFSDTGGWYQPFRASIRFDFNNRMHLATGINNTSAVARNTHILYAYSDDGGQSFHQADGSLIGGLPMRADAGTNQADIVAGQSEYDLFASVSFEENGSPIVFYTDRSGNYDPTYRYWDETNQSWSSEKDHPAGGIIKIKYLLDNKGIQTLIDGDPGGKIRRTYDISETSYLAHSFYRRFHGMDEFGIHDSGILTGITGSSKENDGPLTISEMIIDVDTDPLPGNWVTQAIGTSINTTAGDIKGVFEVEGSGSGISNDGDELSFIKQSMTGDGEIIGRVINVGYQAESSIAGLMIRSSNENDASMITSSITYAEGAMMHSRLTKGANVSTAILEKYRPAEWLKITREGDIFTSFRSDDGINWTTIGTETIEMPEIVQAGFFVSSTVTGKTSQAHVDHLSISGTITQGQAPYSGIPTTLPGTIQVEEYDIGGLGIAYSDKDGINEGSEFRADGVDIELCLDTDGGYNVGWTEQGEWLEYTVEVTADDLYNFEFRIASIYSTGALSIDLDEDEIIPTQTIPSTNDWQTWASLYVNGVALSKGVHVLRLNIVSGSFNINNIIVTSTVTGQLEQQISPIALYPNPTNGNITISSNSGFHGRFELFTLLGEPVKSGRLSNDEKVLNLSDKPSGIYILQFHNDQGSYFFEIEKQ